MSRGGRGGGTHISAGEFGVLHCHGAGGLTSTQTGQTGQEEQSSGDTDGHCPQPSITSSAGVLNAVGWRVAITTTVATSPSHSLRPMQGNYQAAESQGRDALQDPGQRFPASAVTTVSTKAPLPLPRRGGAAWVAVMRPSSQVPGQTRN